MARLNLEKLSKDKKESYNQLSPHIKSTIYICNHCETLIAIPRYTKDVLDEISSGTRHFKKGKDFELCNSCEKSYQIKLAVLDYEYGIRKDDD